MSERTNDNLDAVAGRVLDRLKAVREASMALPDDARRGALAQALEGELGGMSDESADGVVAVVKERLVAEARGRERRVIELEGQVRALEERLTSVVEERDRLQREVGEKNEAAASAKSGGDLTRLREGLLRVSRGDDVTPDQLGLPTGDARLFRLIRLILDFALRYEIGLNVLLAEFKIGPAGSADSLLIQGLQEQVRERFRACLEDKEGSLQALQEVLERNARFLIEINRSYHASIYEGNHSVLAQLDPQPILDKHKRVLGSDYEGAWRALSREHADLINLSRGELWERFFLDPFQKKLSGGGDR